MEWLEDEPDASEGAIGGLITVIQASDHERAVAAQHVTNERAREADQEGRVRDDQLRPLAGPDSALAGRPDWSKLAATTP